MDQQARVEQALSGITEDFSMDGSEEAMVDAVAKRLTSDRDVDKHILRVAREMWILHDLSKPTHGVPTRLHENNDTDVPASAAPTSPDAATDPQS